MYTIPRFRLRITIFDKDGAGEGEELTKNAEVINLKT